MPLTGDGVIDTPGMILLSLFAAKTQNNQYLKRDQCVRCFGRALGPFQGCLARDGLLRLGCWRRR